MISIASTLRWKQDDALHFGARARERVDQAAGRLDGGDHPAKILRARRDACASPHSIDFALSLHPMSYVVHAWEGPVPSSIQEAIAMHAALCDEPSWPSPKLAVFAQRLLSRHPLPSWLDGASNGGRWLDDSLAAPVQGPVLSFGIAPESRGALSTFVAQAAAECDVVLLDEQEGSVFLPDGSALRASGRVRVVPDKEAFKSADVHGGLVQRAYGLMTPRGWSLHQSQTGRYQFVQACNGLSFSVDINAGTSAQGVVVCRPLFSIGIRASNLPALKERFPVDGFGGALNASFQAMLDESFVGRLPAGLNVNDEGGIEVHGVQDLPALSRWFMRAVVESVEPLLARCRTLPGLDDMVNDPASPAAIAVRRLGNLPNLRDALILAHLADRGRLDALRALAETRWRELQPQLAERARDMEAHNLRKTLTAVAAARGEGPPLPRPY